MISQLIALLSKQEVYSTGTKILLKTCNSVPLADKSSEVLVTIRVLSYGIRKQKAHHAYLHCVDWNPINENLILTGSADNTVRLFDHRNLTTNGIGSPVHIFENHTAAVLCVQWSPDKSSVFGSSVKDGILNVQSEEGSVSGGLIRRIQLLDVAY
ncbi:WD40 repeat-containing protein MSI4-like protein [Tanacetum coccineum]